MVENQERVGPKFSHSLTQFETNDRDPAKHHIGLNGLIGRRLNSIGPELDNPQSESFYSSGSSVKLLKLDSSVVFLLKVSTGLEMTQANEQAQLSAPVRRTSLKGR